MSKKNLYKKNNKRETAGQKFINFVLTAIIAIVISSQVCTAANNNLRIAQVSDAHFSSFEANTSYKFLEKSGELLNDTIFQLNTSGPYDFVIFTGDMINKPKTSELEKFLEHIKPLKWRWYAVFGNHDIAIDGPLTKEKYLQTLKKNNSNIKSDKYYYAFTPKNGYRVLCLDSIIDYKLTSNGEYSQEEVEWLKQELNTHKKDVIVICTHVPILEPYSSVNHKLKNDTEIQKILTSYSNTIVVLQGHYHCSRIKKVENVIYVTCPSLVTYPNAYRVVNINSNKKRVLVDIFIKDTNLKDIQSRAKLRVFGSNSLSGDENDRNISFTIKKEGK